MVICPFPSSRDSLSESRGCRPPTSEVTSLQHVLAQLKAGDLGETSEHLPKIRIASPPTVLTQCSVDRVTPNPHQDYDNAVIMQTIWSRIAQGSGAGSACKCPQCLTFAGGLTRRVGAGATRQKPKYLTSSTLWYSGIFAAAATLDAGAKLRRREKWDKAIAEVRQELGKEEKVGLTWDKEKSVEVAQEVDTVLYKPDVLDEAFEELEPTFRDQRWPANTGPPLVTRNLAPESIYAKRGRREKVETRQWTRKKLERISLSVDLLQLRIMIALIDGGLSDEGATAVPEEYGANLLRTRDALHAHKQTLKHDYARLRLENDCLDGYKRTSRHLPLNVFSMTEADEYGYHTVQTPRELNIALQSLLKQHKRQKISTPTLLARICYNLSASPLPPNLDTYNTLLLGLSAAEQPHIVTHVIRSLRQCNLRPNETSITAILNHYTATDDAASFVHFVETMRGKHLGLALARPDVRITAVSNGRLVPKEGDPTKIIQLPYPTPKVFAALISGVTKFGGFDTALGVCKNMGEEGWGLCMSGLAPLLQDCADRRDWEAGLSVWDQVQQLKARSKRQEFDQHRGHERVPMRVYAAMLRLCLSKGEKKLYEEVWNEATRAHRASALVIAQMVKDQMSLANQPAAKKVEPAALVDDQVEAEEILEERSSPVQPGTGAAKFYPASSILRELRESQRGPMHRQPAAAPQSELLREHLYGTLPASDELEQYEVTERPMYLRG